MFIVLPSEAIENALVVPCSRELHCMKFPWRFTPEGLEG